MAMVVVVVGVVVVVVRVEVVAVADMVDRWGQRMGENACVGKWMNARASLRERK